VHENPIWSHGSIRLRAGIARDKRTWEVHSDAYDTFQNAFAMPASRYSIG
jgi:hypothetical protein